jgi:benzaldehyde dehydrogenase (NAD)
MTFLDGQRWQGKIFDGTWRAADGGERPVIEPATGDKLGTVGFAALSDLERSALRAREAQVAWAAVPFSERAAVMRGAAELWKNHCDDIQSWLIRDPAAPAPRRRASCTTPSTSAWKPPPSPRTLWGKCCRVRKRR